MKVITLQVFSEGHGSRPGGAGNYIHVIEPQKRSDVGDRSMQRPRHFPRRILVELAQNFRHRILQLPT